MRAILLAAGYGTRLKPLTDNTPKCLLPVNGKPLLQIWVDNLINIGIEKILINTHYLHEQVYDFFEKNNYSTYVTLTNEKKLLGTAGTLIKNINFYNNEDGFLIHSDNYSLENLANFVQAHHNRPKHTLISMMTFHTNSPESCGIVEIDETSTVRQFHEKVKNPPGNLANAAVYILSNEFLKDISIFYKDKSDFSCEVLPNYLRKIYTYETKEFFIDIGNALNYNFANNFNAQIII